MLGVVGQALVAIGILAGVLEAAVYLSTPQDADAAFDRGLDLLIAGLDEFRPKI